MTFWRELERHNTTRIADSKGPVPPAANTAKRNPGGNVKSLRPLNLSQVGWDGLESLAHRYHYRNINAFLEALGWDLFDISPQPLPSGVHHLLYPDAHQD